MTCPRILSVIIFLILLTNQGKKIVRKHQYDKDAHKVYANLSVNEIKSTNYLLNNPSNSLTSHQTVLDMGPGAVL